MRTNRYVKYLPQYEAVQGNQLEHPTNRTDDLLHPALEAVAIFKLGCQHYKAGVFASELAYTDLGQ